MDSTSEFENASGAKRPVRALPTLRVSVAAATDIGQVRPNNEDSFLVFDLGRRETIDAAAETVIEVAPPGLLVAVADGLGGHKGGQVASALGVESLASELLATLSQKDVGPDTGGQALRDAVEAANRTIHRAAGGDPELHGMGTTLTAILLNGSEILAGHVGDSRAYLMRDNRLYQLTTDQTVGNLYGDQLGPELDNRMSDVLVQAVGTQPTIEVEMVAQEIAQGDLLMICCDGLYKVVSGEEIQNILEGPGSLDDRIRSLIERANQYGGPDNITVVAVEVLELQP